MKYVIASLALLVSVVNPAAAIDSEPILRAFDTKSGAEVTVVQGKDGMWLLMMDGKQMAELAPDSMTVPSNGYEEIKWTYQPAELHAPKVPESGYTEVEWTYQPGHLDGIEFEYNCKSCDEIKWEY